MNHDKPIFSQPQTGAEMYAPKSTYLTDLPIEFNRTDFRDFIQNYLTNILGQNTARQYAENIAGADPNNPMPRNPMGLGLSDFTPLGLLFAGQEVKEDFGKASRPLDYVAPTIGGALSIAEAFPLTKVMVKGVSKPVAGFLSNLNRKSVDSEADLKIPEKPEPLMTSPGPKTTRDDETNVKPPKKGVSRRGFLQGVVAAPVVAGALSEIPAGKVIEDVAPVVKDVASSAPRMMTSATFENLDEHLGFAADLWKARTGKSISKKEILEKDMAEYLNYYEEGDLYHESPNRLSEGPNVDLLSSTVEDQETGDIIPEAQERVDAVMNKYFGEDGSEEIVYGGGLDSITEDAFKEAFPGVDDYDETDIIRWIKTQGIEKTAYYKKLVKDQNVTQQDMIEYAMERAAEARKRKAK